MNDKLETALAYTLAMIIKSIMYIIMLSAIGGTMYAIFFGAASHNYILMALAAPLTYVARILVKCL